MAERVFIVVTLSTILSLIDSLVIKHKVRSHGIDDNELVG